MFSGYTLFNMHIPFKMSLHRGLSYYCKMDLVWPLNEAVDIFFCFSAGNELFTLKLLNIICESNHYKGTEETFGVGEAIQNILDNEINWTNLELCLQLMSVLPKLNCPLTPVSGFLMSVCKGMGEMTTADLLRFAEVTVTNKFDQFPIFFVTVGSSALCFDEESSVKSRDSIKPP